MDPSHTVPGAPADLGPALRTFLQTREGARRFHKALIGDVDPDWCFADFLVSVGRQKTDRLEKVYRSTYIKSPLAEDSGVTGGYLVPSELHDELMQDVSEEAIVRPRAIVIPMTGASMLLPLPDASTAQAGGVSPFFGGVRMVWTSEGALRTETEPKFRQVELKPWELAGYAVISNNLLSDAAGVEPWLRRLFGRSIAWYEDYAFLRGSNLGQPQGMLTSPALNSVARNTSNRFEYVDAAKMLANLLPHSYANAIWAISVGFTGTVNAISELVQLVDATGKTAWVPNYGDRTDSRSMGALFGRPVYPTEKLPDLGTLGDVMLFDPTLYVIGDRQQITIDVSIHVDFLSTQTVWRFIDRVDGEPWFSKAITLQDTTSVVSPYVALD